MPFVRVDMLQGTLQEYRRHVGEIVYQTLLAVLSVPKNDRFQIFAEHSKALINTVLQLDRQLSGNSVRTFA